MIKTNTTMPLRDLLHILRGHGLTQRQIAAQIGLTDAQLSYYSRAGYHAAITSHNDQAMLALYREARRMPMPAELTELAGRAGLMSRD